jgi:competence protein ComEA
MEELEMLPKIGPAMARRIIEYRETHGPFTIPRDIIKVKGIGEKTYFKLKDLITVK